MPKARVPFLIRLLSTRKDAVVAITLERSMQIVNWLLKERAVISVLRSEYCKCGYWSQILDARIPSGRWQHRQKSLKERLTGPKISFGNIYCLDLLANKGHKES